MQYTDNLTSPEIFRKWGGIAAISAALERKVWMISKEEPVFANLYLILVGAPGVGKSTVLSRVERMLDELKDMNLAPSSVTAAALTDVLDAAKRSIVRPSEQPPVLEFNHVSVIASEFGVFLPMYEPSMMNALTKLYDGERYREARRGKDLRIDIKKPLLSLAAGCTPAYLIGTMPDAAWDQGFLSRTNLIFSAEVIVSDPFATNERSAAIESLRQDLASDLRSIHSIVGKIAWDPDAAAAVTVWNREGQPPKPIHPRLQHYNTRRLFHLLKLSMIASISRTNEMVITLEDYQTALDWMIEAEAYMPDLFKSSGVGGDSTAIEETWHFVYMQYMKLGQKPIGKHRVLRFIGERVNAQSVNRVFELMVQTRRLIMVGPDGVAPAVKDD